MFKVKNKNTKINVLYVAFIVFKVINKGTGSMIIDVVLVIFFVNFELFNIVQKVLNLFKVNNKDTRTTSLMSFRCLYC